jgi:serine/threonine protein kinase
MANSLPVNDNALYRILVLVTIKLLKRWRPHRGNVLLISNGLCIKHGRLVSLSEAASMRFISHSTSIPVPKVVCAFERRGRTYLVMKRIDGDMLGAGWLKRSARSQVKILAQLREMIQEMRRISPAHCGGVSNIDGGSLFDCRLPGPSLRFGPFRNIQDFHSYLRGDINFHPGNDPNVNELITFHRADWPLVFTHGDLSSLNILVRGDEVVGIIDWETAGWYPAYWEYTTACQVNPQNSFWRDEIDRFLDPYPTELAMEKIRWKYFGDF